MKIKNFFILFFALVFCFCAEKIGSATNLKIYSENPHFLEYNGEPIMTFAFSGINLSGQKHAKVLVTETLPAKLYSSSRKQCGINQVYVNLLPYKNGNMQNGFNQTFWNNLRGEIKNYKNLGGVVMVNIWSTPEFEMSDPYEITPASAGKICDYINTQASNYWAPDRFEASLWGDLRGGPIPTPINYNLLMIRFMNGMYGHKDSFVNKKAECDLATDRDQCLSFLKNDLRIKAYIELAKDNLGEKSLSEKIKDVKLNNLVNDFYNNIVMAGNYEVLLNVSLPSWLGAHTPSNVGIGDPKDSFYTLDNGGYYYPVTTVCKNESTWQKKNQCYQDQLIQKIYSELGSLDNWMLRPMYEIGDYGGVVGGEGKVANWVNHIKKLAKSLDSSRLIVYEGGGGGNLPNYFDVISQQGIVSGINYLSELRNKLWNKNKPIVYTGYDALDADGVRMDNQKQPWASYSTEEYKGRIGYNCILQLMRNFILNGIGPASFFHYDKNYYNANYYSVINNYAIALSNFLETVQTWNNEPGNEIKNSTIPATGMNSCPFSLSCSCGNWVAKNCGESCGINEVLMERECSPLNCDIQSECAESPSVCKQFLPFDLNGDGSVNVRDLGIIFSFWNSSGSSCGSFCVNDPDIDNSGSVFSGDVFSIFQNWTY